MSKRSPLRYFYFKLYLVIDTDESEQQKSAHKLAHAHTQNTTQTLKKRRYRLHTYGLTDEGMQTGLKMCEDEDEDS